MLKGLQKMISPTQVRTLTTKKESTASINVCIIGGLSYGTGK
jgi:hypothetical protein